MDHQDKSISLPNAIVVAGVLIALAIVFAGRGFVAYSVPTSGNAAQASAPDTVGSLLPSAGSDQTNLDKMRPVTSADHIRGNPNAPVKIVEYSDLECPFCKEFQATLQQAMSEYEASGQVAWVYRQFPIATLHPKAPNEAEASECANELGGNDTFWKFVDRVYQVTNSNNSLDPAQLPIIAQYVGLDVTQFNTCLAAQKYTQKIAADIQNAQDTGGNGTPWTIVVAANGQKFPVAGAVSYDTLKQTIEQALAAK